VPIVHIENAVQPRPHHSPIPNHARIPVSRLWPTCFT
jgi:hypothetical protein